MSQPSRGYRGARVGRAGAPTGGHSHTRIKSDAFNHANSWAESSSKDDDDTEEVKVLRTKYGGQKLNTIKEFFPNWSEEDLLFVLQEASGDLELAISRISDGHAQQWASAKPKKSKKDSTGSPLPSDTFIDLSGNHLEGGRGRGRGSSRGGRGGFEGRGRGRGGDALRGGRGGGRGRGRGRENGLSHSANGSTDAAEATPTTNGDSNGSAWGADAVADAPEPVAESSGGWREGSTDLAPAQSQEPDSSGWGDAQPVAPVVEEKENGVQIDAEPTVSPWGDTKSKANGVDKAKFKTIPKGSTMSWAQIAKPKAPPAPKPAPVPVVVAPEPTIEIPPAELAPVANESFVDNDPWGPSAQIPPQPTTDIWADTQRIQTPALGMGEGWAETVLAVNHHDELPAGHLTPSQLPEADADPAGPIEVSSIPQPVEPTAVSRHVEVQIPQPIAAPQTVATPNSVASTIPTHPPGLSKRANARKHQEDAVVMPGGERTPGLERVGVQFGSLNLFGDGQLIEESPILHKEDVDQSPPKQKIREVEIQATQPQIPVQSASSHLSTSESRISPATLSSQPPSLSTHEQHAPSITDKLLPPQLSSHQSLHQQSQSQQQHPSLQQHQQQQQAALSVLSHPSQQVSTPAQQVSNSTSPFGNRYQIFSGSGGSGNAYGLQNNTPQQSQVDEQQPSLSSAYSNYAAASGGNKDVLGPNYFQSSNQQQQTGGVTQASAASNTPASVSNGPSNYGQQQHPFGTSGVFGSGISSGGSLNTSNADYVGIYGQDPLRNMGFYEGYTPQQIAQLSFQQSRSPLPGAGLHDEPSKSGPSSTTAPSNVTQGPSAAQQPQGFPGAPIYYPYPYQYQPYHSTYPTHGMSAPPSYAQPYGVTTGYYPMVPQQQIQQAAAQQAAGVGRNGFAGQGVGGTNGLASAGVSAGGFRGASNAGYPYGMGGMGYGYEGGQAANTGLAGVGGGVGVGGPQSLRGLGGSSAGMGGQGLSSDSRKDYKSGGESHFNDRFF